MTRAIFWTTLRSDSLYWTQALRVTPILEINAVHSLLILARKGDAEAVPIIQKLAKSSDEYVRKNATGALAELAA